MSKKAILAVSFGTSYHETMEKTIGFIEKKISEKYRECDIFRAFTSSIIVKKLKGEGFDINGVKDELNRILNLGYEECYIQPTHMIAGIEYEKVLREAEEFKDKFKVLKIGKPLFQTTNDLKKLVKILGENVEFNDGEAVVLMGHGSEHCVNTVYAALDYMFKDFGYENFFVGTVEAYPDLETVLKFVKAKKYKKAVLMPLLMVAGDHALNDMAGDEDDSWVNIFNSNGVEARAVVKGIGEYAQVAEMYIEHIQEYLNI